MDSESYVDGRSVRDHERVGRLHGTWDNLVLTLLQEKFEKTRIKTQTYTNPQLFFTVLQIKIMSTYQEQEVTAFRLFTA